MDIFSMNVGGEKLGGSRSIALTQDGVFIYEGPDGIKRSVTVLTAAEARIFLDALSCFAEDGPEARAEIAADPQECGLIGA